MPDFQGLDYVFIPEVNFIVYERLHTFVTFRNGMFAVLPVSPSFLLTI
jgi:hypothetical protein